VAGENSGSAGVIVAPESVFLRLAIVCAIGSLVIFGSAQPYSPLGSTLVALSIMAGLSLALAYMPEDTLLRSTTIVATALLAAPLGYFFGPNSAFTAILAILLAMTGLLSARQPGRRAKTGWLVMIVVAAGQLGVVILVAYDVVPDISLAPSKRSEFASWQAVTAHLVVTTVFVSAFLAGRAAQQRYRRLVVDALDASRSVAIREALLEEARADYERALALQARADATTSEPSTQGGTDKLTTKFGTTQTERDVTETTRDELFPQPRPAVAIVDDGSRVRLTQALRSKMRIQDLAVLGACVAGIYFTASLVKAPMPRIVSLVAIIGIAVMIAIRALILYSKPTAVIAWPYPVIAALSAGPAYGFGLHAAFAAIVATFVFTGRLFRSPGHHPQSAYALLAVCIPQGLVFVLVMTGVLPDTSNLPLQLPGFSASAATLHHLAVQAIFIGAFVLGGRIDREFVRAFELARFAYAEAMRADARLQIARTELDAALEVEGLFTGTALGDYQLGRLLGRGGMGEVYEANAHGNRVALKLLRADRLGDPVALERFQHEANLLTRIASPYCAKVIEVSSSAVPYLAMEYVEGPALSAVLRDRGRLDSTELIALVDDLARGLDDVHAAGVVHLDLKPSNVLRGGTRWKIVDFGISRMLTGEAHRRVAGTPPYMAPEQALGEPLDTRTDLYALSLILYRAITGRPAFTGSDAAVIANRARELGPPDPRELVSIDEDLALVLRIGLAARIGDRFASATELRNAFIGALGGRLDPLVRNRGRALLARAPWALYVSLVTGRMEISRSTR
jgi:tRNA A-37 threonylcarbamoyl transferase component Bud32